MRSSLLLAALALVITPLFGVGSAHAQATRTWVSGVGDDVNPCSRTAPCKTFAGAISKTAASGEINCLDPGGFGAVTITKSMTIDCEGTFGSILAAGTNGVNINDAATATPNTIRVILRNISIHGAGTGLVGVNFVSGSSLELRNVKIFGFAAGSAQGLRVVSNAASQTAVFDSEISYNANAGIFVDPAAASALVTLQRVQLNKNLEGMRVSGAGAGVIFATVQDSIASMNGSHGFVAQGGSSVTLSIQRSSSNTNGSDGIRAEGAGAVVNIGSSMVTQNTTGFNQAGGIIKSYGNNALDGNTSNGTTTAPNLTPL